MVEIKFKKGLLLKYKQFVENCFRIIPRQSLHAKSLAFEHPKTGKWLEFNSDIPKDMQEVIEKCGECIPNTKGINKFFSFFSNTTSL